MPGLVNCHHHMYQTLTRAIGTGAGMVLFDWLKALYPVWAELDPEAIRVSTQIALAELMLSGATTVADHLYLFPNGSRLDDSIDAARDMGMRFHATRGSMSVGESQGGLPPDRVCENEDAILADSQRLIETHHDAARHAMTRIALAPCSPFSVSADLMRQSAALARSHAGVHLHTHLAETLDEERYCVERVGMRPVAYAQSLGWLGPDVWFAHMVHVSPAEIALLASTQTGIAHCPQSNGRLGSGVAPIADMLKAGVRVSLAVDGAASNEAADMLSEAHACWLLQRSAHGAGSLRVDDVVALGTRGGAQVLGLEDVGTLAVGMAADLVVYDLDQPCHVGIHDTGSAPVISGRAKVDALYIQGQLRVQGGVVPGLDMPSLRAQARAAVAVLRSLG
jgi:cytosine/adenosine deaminase-related metal-dependent hydrolase